MSSSSYDFIHNPSLPSDEDIVARCEEHKFPQGITITDPSTHSVIAWVKCGVNVALGEAHMQHWTAMALREAGISNVQVASVFRAFTAVYQGSRVGYIAMQYIEGADCDSKDVDLIARVDQPQSTINRDTRTLRQRHKTDQDFYDHIQKILKMLRIDFQGDISDYDRYLCLSDFNPGNFRKSMTPDGQSVVVVLDFGATCFMPLPFIEVALKKDRDIFRQSLIERIKYPRARSEDVQALLSASYRLVQYGWGPIALPPGVSPRFSRK